MISERSMFLKRLRMIEARGLHVRDVLMLDAVHKDPGINGKDLGLASGFPERSHVQAAIHRLIKLGLIEDRRRYVGKAVPNELYETAAARQFWEDLKCM